MRASNARAKLQKVEKMLTFGKWFWVFGKWLLESQIVRTVIIVASAILGAFAYNKAENWKVRREGRKEERAEHKQKLEEARQEARETVDEVHEVTDGMSDADVRRVLLERYRSD